MKQSFFSFSLLTLLVLAFSCNQNTSDDFTMNITINGTNDTKLILQQNIDGNWTRADSAEMVEGQAVLKGKVDMPELFYVTLEGTRAFMPVFVENGNINVTAEFEKIRNPQVTGSETHKKYIEFNESLADIDVLYNELNMQYRTARADNDSVLMEQISNEYMELDRRKADHIKNYAIRNNTSVVSPYVIQTYSYMFDADDLEDVANSLDPSIKNSTYTKYVENRLATLKRVAIGQPFVDFSLNDPDGNIVPLASVTGKNYVLVDFWASWCQPCRRENPNIVDAYNKYHKKGFDVFGVSFDREYNDWVQAIQADNLTWTHVSDLKYWSSQAGKLYGVQSIPHSLLLDPDGIIIAKNLRGEALQNKLAELLN
jgi:peroxiredoxin